MTHLRAASRRLAILLVVFTLGLTPALTAFPPAVAYAQDLSADPKAVSPTPTDLRVGFQLVPEKSEQREPVPGIIVYEADFVRDQTPQNFANGPIEVKSLVAKTANSQQAAEQFTSSRQALTTASPPWVESKVAKLGDESTGLTMQGTSSAGPAVAHLFLFRRGAMVVGITVAGLEKPTRMAEAEAIAATTLRKIDPQFAAQTGPQRPRPLNAQGAQQRPTSGAQRPTGAQPSTGAQPPANQGSANQPSSGGGQRLRVANTGGTGVRLRTSPSRTARVAGVLPEGTTLEVVGPDAQGDGLTWKNVRAPGDGRGYVAADYTAPVPGAASSGSSTTAASANNTPAASQTRTNTSAPASTAASSPGSTTPANTSASTTADALKVDVSVKSGDLKAGEEQTVSVTVTKNGQPVPGAQVTVKTSPTGETPAASPTDGGGKTSVTWKPAGPGPFIGVGVSVLTSDGNAGVGGASFRLT